MALTVTATLDTGETSTLDFADPLRAAHEIVIGIGLGVLLRVNEYTGTAEECATYADEVMRLTEPFEGAWSL